VSVEDKRAYHQLLEQWAEKRDREGLTDHQLLERWAEAFVKDPVVWVGGSDFMWDHRLFRDIMRARGTVTDDEFKQFVKSNEQLSNLLRGSLNPPICLIQFAAKVLDGSISLSGGQRKKGGGIDLCLIFDNLKRMAIESGYFPSLRVGDIYQAMAEALEKLPDNPLNIPSTEKASSGSNGTTLGAERIRQDLLKFRKRRERFITSE